MRNEPAAADLLDAVTSLLRNQMMPLLEGQTAFTARVAANVLETLRREWVHGAAADAAERGRLCHLLGENGELEALNRALCQRVADGDMTVDTPGLLEHLRYTILDRLAIDQPSYAAYQRVLTDGWAN